MDVNPLELCTKKTGALMKRENFHEKLVEHLRKQPWFQVNELEELDAAVSHWIQSPDLKFPCFTNTMRNESYAFAAGKINENISKAPCVCEEPETYQAKLTFIFNNLPYPPPEKWDFTFIDLFAGIGGFRLAFQNAGGKCIFSSEWDKYAKQTYEANFGEYPYGDIRKIIKSEIPDHDVLCAGFPCQPFSLAGVSKKKSLGRKHGFEDETSCHNTKHMQS